ncbi:MAG: hypothetical protein RL240_1270, partial [Planctomycetota bacterium]
MGEAPPREVNLSLPERAMAGL